MNVDTTEFAALTEEAATVIEATRAAYRLGWETGVRHGRRLDDHPSADPAPAPAAAPRRSRPRHLKVVQP